MLAEASSWSTRRCSETATARRAGRSRRRSPRGATSSATSIGKAPSSSRRAFRSDLVSVFVLPPSVAALEARLSARAQDSAAVVASRMAKSAEEMSHWPEYDYVIVNRDVEESVAQVRAIVTAERLRRIRQPGLAEFVNSLRAG